MAYKKGAPIAQCAQTVGIIALSRRDTSLWFVHFRQSYRCGVSIAQTGKDVKRRMPASYQVREAIARNCATVVVWEFRPPSTVMIWPVI